MFIGKTSKSIPLPEPADASHGNVVAAAATEAARWTTAIRDFERRKCIVYVTDHYAPPPPPASLPPTNPHHGHDASKRPRRDPHTQSDVSASTIHTSSQQQRRDPAYYNLHLGRRADDTDILATYLAKGKTGDQEAQARLGRFWDPSTIATDMQQANPAAANTPGHSAKRRDAPSSD